MSVLLDCQLYSKDSIQLSFNPDNILRIVNITKNIESDSHYRHFVEEYTSFIAYALAEIKNSRGHGGKGTFCCELSKSDIIYTTYREEFIEALKLAVDNNTTKIEFVNQGKYGQQSEFCIKMYWRTMIEFDDLNI
jgi:hypothetical protein